MTLRKPPDNLTRDPEEILTGKCQVCGMVIEVPRFEASQVPAHKSSDPLAELPFAECQTCKERSPKKAEEKVGTKVYLTVRPKPSNLGKED